MANLCSICEKKRKTGNNRKLLRGHYNVTSKRTFKPNLQKISHEGKRIHACVSCIRTLSKEGK